MCVFTSPCLTWYSVLVSLPLSATGWPVIVAFPGHIKLLTTYNKCRFYNEILLLFIHYFLLLPLFYFVLILCLIRVLQSSN